MATKFFKSLFCAVVLLFTIGIGNVFGISSTPSFKVTKTSASPTGAGVVYGYRGGGDYANGKNGQNDKLTLPDDGDWKSADATTEIFKKKVQMQKGSPTGDNEPDGYAILDKSDQDNQTAGETEMYLHMYFFAKPNAGYQFDGWYSDAGGTTEIAGSRDHWPMPGKTSGVSSVAEKKRGPSSGRYTPVQWDNGEGLTDAKGYYAAGGFFYLRDAIKIPNNYEGMTVYAKFSIKPRTFTLAATGQAAVTYTATGHSGPISTSNVTTSALSSDIALNISIPDPEQYIFEGWYWSDGKDGAQTLISEDATSATFEWTKNSAIVALNNVWIWPKVNRVVNNVAEVTYNDVTTPYETWDAALAAAKAVSGATITLNKSVSDMATVQTINKSMTIDLNGNTLSGTANNFFTITGSGVDVTITDNSPQGNGRIELINSTDATTYTVTVQSGAKLTLSGGTIYNRNENASGTARGLEVKSGTTLLVDGGHIEAQSLQNAYALINRGTTTISDGDMYAHTTSAATAVAYLNNGTTTAITGGLFRAYAKTTTAYGIEQNVANTLTITNATVQAEAVTSTAYALARNSGVIVVDGGKYKAVAPATVAPVNVITKNVGVSNTLITLRGGIYNIHNNLTKCTASGYGRYDLVYTDPDYADGYRYVIMNKSSEPYVCKVLTTLDVLYYKTVEEAFEYVNAHSDQDLTIVITASECALSAGTYTLPGLATLLVPYDVGGTVSINKATYYYNANSTRTRECYCKLTLESGVNLKINGKLNVNALLHNRAGGQMTACVLDNYGRLQMNEGSHIDLENSSACSVWGFITGTGTITAKSGSFVREAFQFDFRGGTHISSTMSAAFPMSQYYVQNIEVPITFNYGATENLFTCCYASSADREGVASFIGSTGMFRLESASTLTRRYVESEDRIYYDLYGNSSIQDITVDVQIAEMASKDYILPINSNMTLRVHNGTTTIYYDLSLLPDSRVVIDEGASVEVKKNLYIYDKSDWRADETGYTYQDKDGNTQKSYFAVGADLNQVPFSPTKTFTRKSENLTDAHVVVNGTLKTLSSNGKIYTTTNGADIISEGNGKIILGAAAGGNTSFKQGVSTASKTQSIPVTAAQLHNENGTYIATAGAAANTTYQYCDGTWKKGGCDSYTIVWKSEDGNTTLETDAGLANGTATEFNGSTPSKAATDQYAYTFDGWTTADNGGGTFYANGATPTVSGNATYYAHFSQTPRSYTLSWVTDGDVLTGSYTSGTVAYATTITAPDTPTKTGYTFAGWHNGSSVVTPSTMPAENTTYTATWTCLEPSSLSVASTGNKWDFCAGESMTLTVIGSNIAADATYQWKLNGSPISGATGSTYMVASMARANAGTYTCTVTNGTCNATTSGYDIKVWTFYHNASGSFAHGNLTFSSAGKGTITVELAAGQTYEFKLNNNMPSGNWFGNAGTMTGTIAEASAWVFGSSINSNCHITAGLAGNYEFIVDYSNSGSPKVIVTYPTANQPSGRKIYFDKSGIDGWGSNVYYRIGHTTYNSNQTLSLVPGTDQFYEMTTNGFDGFEAWQIANNVSWSGDGNSIYLVNPDGTTYDITKATNFQKYVVGSDGVTIVPTTENNTENGCTYWNVSTSDGMLTHTATISTSANGTITIFYTDVNGASQSKTSTTAGLAHRCILTITATPNPGYSLSSLTVNGAPFTSGNTYILAADATIAATWANVVIGSPLDIVDWTETELTLNANGWAASGWPYTINGTTYYKDQKSATDAGSSNYRAADRTLTIPYGGEAGADLWITLESGGSIINKNSYSIPFINTTSGTNASSIVYVNSGTLTISSNTSLAALYVRPESRVNITSGTLTVGKLVMRTLPWQAAAINGDFEAAEVWYTRIAPNKRTITGPYAPITYESSSYYQFALPRNCTVKLKDVQVSHGANTPYGNTWILKRYNEETRAANGTGEANWVVLDEEEYIQGGVGYEMSSNSNYYREFYFPLGAVSSASIGTTTAVNFHSGAAGTQHAGWNWVASPLMGVFDNSDADPETGMKIGWLLTDGSYDQGIPDYIYPAIPFAYQTSSGQSTISFAGSYIVASVPQRRVAAEEESVLLQWFHLDVKDVTGVGDHTSILTHPMRYEEAYKPGIDVAKQSFAASHALIYSSHAYGEMAFAGVADSLFEHGVALTVYSPKAQELTISMRENEWLSRMAYVWLIDQATGAQIDLLESDYSFEAEAGTTAGRFILMGAFFAPQITTDNGTVQSDDKSVKATKFIYKDKMYIQINGVIYDATGKLVR